MENTKIKEEQPVSVIDQALVKANLTDAVIAELKTYKELKINGLTDKEGFKKVYEARQRCKNTRVLTVKICEKGREDAVAEQRRWLTKQKEIVSQIVEVEDYLQEQETAIENEKKRLKEEADRKEQDRIQRRVVTLLGLGMAFNGNSYFLAGNEIDSAKIKALSDAEFDSFVEHVKIEYDRIQAEVKLAKERNAELLSYGFQYPFNDLGEMVEEHYHKMRNEHREAFEEKQREADRVKKQAIAQEAERKRLDEQQRKFDEEQARKKAELQVESDRINAEKKSLADKIQDTRMKQLFAMGLKFNGESFIFQEEGVYINFHHFDLLSFDDAKWDKEYTKAKLAIDEYNIQQEENRKQELKEAEEKAAELARLKEQERLKKEEEDRVERERIAKEEEQERINALSDKEKMSLFAGQIEEWVNNLIVPTLKTKKHIAKLNKVVEAINGLPKFIRE